MHTKRRGWFAFGFGAGAVLWSLGLVLGAFLLPAYAGEGCQATPGAAPTCGALPAQTLFAVNGWWVVELLLAVTVVTALGVWALHEQCSSGSERAHRAAVVCVIALAAFAFVTGFSIGLFVVPVALLLFVSAALTPAPTKQQTVTSSVRTLERPRPQCRFRPRRSK